jgi:hypothetical protein
MIRKPFQSKLIPHLEMIRECRAKGMSYPQVAGELRSRFGLSAAPSTIFAFVKVRSRRRAGFALLTTEPPRRAPSATTQQTPPSPVRPAVHAPAAANWHFYDPNKPLEKLPLQP